MNQEITVEIHFFLISLLWGGLILLAYDILRIIRRLIKHGTFFLALEDLIFWITASVFIFSMMYRQNNGVIRGFSVMGMMIGMILYHFIFSNYIVKIVVKAIRLLLRPFALAMNILKKWIGFVFSRLKKAVKFLLRQLKKLIKSVKIAVYGKGRAIASKRQQRMAKKAALKKRRKAKPDMTDKKSQAEPVIKKEPAPKFERIDPEELRRRNTQSQTADLINRPDMAKHAGTRHRIEIKR